jgi:DNA-binding winged helix-turn-helix (wHTH) protein
MILACAVAIALTAITIFLVMNTYRSVLTEAFDERSAAYVTAFADSAYAWLESGDEGMLRTSASFLLLGSVLYVQVVSSDGEIIVDDRAQVASSLDLPVLSGDDLRRTLRRERVEGTGTYIDFVLPRTLPSGVDGTRKGYVRMGIDTSSISVRVYGMTLIASGIGAGFDILVLSLLFLLLHRVHREGAGQKIAQQTEKRRESLRRIGGLMIDEAAKSVSLDGKAVRLTPKQFTLLSLLASEAGRVFSEREILDSVWAESGYADSKDVKQYIYLLRRRLSEASDAGAKLIVNVPGFGYKIECCADKGETKDTAQS